MNILFTSAGRRSYILEYFRNALGGNGTIHAVNSSPLAPSFSAADGYAVSPLIYRKEYIPFLLSYCREHKIDMIIPLFDIDLPVLAEHRKEFSEIGVRLLVSSKEFVEICNDKWKTAEYLNAHGFITPKTYLTLEDAKKELSCGKAEFPLVIKPRWGCGSISVYAAENYEELDCLYKMAKRRVFESYLKYESAADKENCVLIQEYMGGKEFGVDIFNDLEGRYVNCAVKEKKSMRSGETDCAVTVENPEIEELCRKLGGITGHIANLDADIMEKDGKYYILEMNARFGGGYPFSHMAGADLPYAVVQWAEGKCVDAGVLGVEVGVAGQKDINIVRLPKGDRI